MIKINTGSNRIVLVGKRYVYKLPIGKRGRLANKAEYINAKDNPDCAITETHWYGLRQERLYDIFVLPQYLDALTFPPEWNLLWEKRLNNRFQIGRDSHGRWKFFDYEDVKKIRRRNKKWKRYQL